MGGGGGAAKLTREKGGAEVHKACRKYQQDWLYLQSMNSVKHQKRRHVGFGVFIVNKSMGALPESQNNILYEKIPK